jgi:RNA polymerase sigma factor (sigma-70 family)
LCVQRCRRVGGRDHSEATLFARAQSGCARSLDQLMRQHEGLVQAVVRRQVLADLSFEEALQAGRIGLWHAILGYDPSRGLAFSTYAWPTIIRQVWRAVKVQRREQRQAAAADRPVGVAADLVEMAVDAAVERALWRLIEGLPERLRYVIVARYGLADAPPAFYREIGAALGVSGEWARRLHQEALARLRQPAASQTLRSLLAQHTQHDYESADARAQRWLRQRGGRRTCAAPRYGYGH